MLIVSSLIAMQSLAMAGTVSTTFKPSATLSGSCSFSVIDASFGEWQPNAKIDAYNLAQATTSNISVLCNNKLPYNIKGSPLSVLTGGAAGRKLLSNAPDDFLLYNIWLNVDHNHSWFGDGSSYAAGTTTYITGTGTGNIITHVLYLGLYNKTYPGYIVTPGNYSDMYTLNLNF